MFTANLTWNKSQGFPISPKMPNKCCHCLNDATETVTVEENGVKLEVPYCADHIDMARDYYNDCYNSQKRKIVKYISWALAPIVAIIFVFYSIAGSNLISGKDDIIKMFADALNIAYTPGYSLDYNAVPFWAKAIGAAILALGLFHVIPYVLDKWLVLHKGAHKMGFWKDRYITYVVPGLTAIKVKKPKDDASEIKYSISFATRNFYDLFNENIKKG